MDKSVEFNKEPWFELGNCMWRKHHSVFQDHLKYIRNDIVKSLYVGILRYVERVQDMHDIEKQIHPPLTKSDIFEAHYWKVRDK